MKEQRSLVPQTRGAETEVNVLGRRGGQVFSFVFHPFFLCSWYYFRARVSQRPPWRRAASVRTRSVAMMRKLGLKGKARAKGERESHAKLRRALARPPR